MASRKHNTVRQDTDLTPNQTGVLPAKFKCALGGEWATADKFSKGQLNKYLRSKTGPNDRITPVSVAISCRFHTGESASQLKCQGPCGMWKDRKQFSTAQIRSRSQWCIQCVNWKMNLDFGDFGDEQETLTFVPGPPMDEDYVQTVQTAQSEQVEQSEQAGLQSYVQPYEQGFANVVEEGEYKDSEQLPSAFSYGGLRGKKGHAAGGYGQNPPSSPDSGNYAASDDSPSCSQNVAYGHEESYGAGRSAVTLSTAVKGDCNQLWEHQQGDGAGSHADTRSTVVGDCNALWANKTDESYTSDSDLASRLAKSLKVQTMQPNLSHASSSGRGTRDKWIAAGATNTSSVVATETSSHEATNEVWAEATRQNKGKGNATSIPFREAATPTYSSDSRAGVDSVSVSTYPESANGQAARNGPSRGHYTAYDSQGRAFMRSTDGHTLSQTNPSTMATAERYMREMQSRPAHRSGFARPSQRKRFKDNLDYEMFAPENSGGRGYDSGSSDDL